MLIVDCIVRGICVLCELRANLRRTGLRQRVDRRMLVQVHAALFSNVWLHDYDYAGPGLTGQDCVQSAAMDGDLD